MADEKSLDDVSGQHSGLAAMTQEILDGAVSDLLDPATRFQDFEGGGKGLFSGHERLPFDGRTIPLIVFAIEKMPL